MMSLGSRSTAFHASRFGRELAEVGQVGRACDQLGAEARDRPEVLLAVEVELGLAVGERGDRLHAVDGTEGVGRDRVARVRADDACRSRRRCRR